MHVGELSNPLPRARGSGSVILGRELPGFGVSL
jgi:hypothetical protein